MSRRGGGGFTLVELLVGMAVLAVLLVMLATVITGAGALWRRSSEQIGNYQGARLAFDLMQRSLGKAVLNPYLDYDDLANPREYVRRSDLRFLIASAGEGGVPGTEGCGQAVFFQVPAGFVEDAAMQGLGGLLNTCGYYVEWCDDPSRPAFVSSTGHFRYRLMQVLEVAEQNRVYNTGMDLGWVSGAAGSSARPVADNVIVLVVRAIHPARDPQALRENYNYDSTADGIPQPETAHQLPPAIALTMVAIDESTAARLQEDAQRPEVIEQALSGRFQRTADYEQDLEELRGVLNAERVGHQVFTAVVPLEESGWSGLP